MSLFDDSDQKAQDATDRIHGDPMIIRPWLQGDLKGAADGSRAVVTVTGVFMKATGQDAFKGNLRGDENVSGTTFSNQPSAIYFSRAEKDRIGYELRKGDRIQLKDGAIFVVFRQARSQFGEITVHGTMEVE